MEANIPQLTALAEHAAALAAAPSPADVFRRLLDATGLAGPHGVVFLVRQGRLAGWGCRGHDAEVAARVRELSLEPDACWLGRALAPDTDDVVFRRPGEELSGLGAPVAVESFALPVRVAGRAAAVVMVERGASDPPCLVTALQVLATVAGQRLECDLAWRKARAKAEERPVPVAAVETAVEAAPTSAAETVAAETAESPPITALEPSAAEDGEHKRQLEARSFARLVATDIRLYNEEAVLLGREHRDLGERLGDQIDRARETFSRRFGDMGNQGMDLLHEALVQVLAAGDSSLLSLSDS